MASRKAIGFVGLDELSLEMAAKAIRHGYDVQAFEVRFSLPLENSDSDTCIYEYTISLE